METLQSASSSRASGISVPAAQIRDVVKNFGDFQAVKGVSFEIKAGECFGLLGPNGAGKSTLISLIYGAQYRTSGQMKVLGLDPSLHFREIKKYLGVVTQENALDEELNVVENLQIFARFVDVPKKQRSSRIRELLDFMSLAHKAEESIKSLSGGMQRRLVFVRALLGQPRFVILDEPTTGLDPAVRHLIWEKIRELKKNRVTVLLTTHYMDEAERLCDRLVIMDQGHLVAEGSPQNLIRRYCPGYVASFSNETPQFIESLDQMAQKNKNLTWQRDSTGPLIRAPQMDLLLEALKNISQEPLLIRPSNLEDVFLHLTGKELSADA